MARPVDVGQVALAPDDLDADWDVIVVGSGPAGSTAACWLARAGARVLVLERAAFPRDKACGDLLIPDALAALDRLGVRARVTRVGHAVPRLRVSSARGVTFDVPSDLVGLPRLQLDALLAAEAVASGARVARGRVERVRAHERGVEVHVAPAPGADPVRLGARFVLLATGADTMLAEQVGMIERPAPSAVALRKYVTADVDLPDPIISFDRAVLPGYAWIFPLGARRFNVGVGLFFDERRKHDVAGRASELRAVLGRFLAENPEGRRLAAATREESPVRGARLRTGLTGTQPLDRSGRILAVGETVGTTYPFTGEGIGKAMESAELAAEVVQAALADGAARTATYPGTLNATLRARYDGYRTAERWLGRAWVGDLVSWRVRRSGRLRRAAEDVLAERTDPGTIFSPWTLVRSLFG